MLIFGIKKGRAMPEGACCHWRKLVRQNEKADRVEEKEELCKQRKWEKKIFPGIKKFHPEGSFLFFLGSVINTLK